MRTLARVFVAALVAGLCLTAFAQPVLAYHPNHPLGFSPERSYQGVGQIDSVDLFSGSLSLSLSVGPFPLNYNSNVWRYRPVIENEELEIEAQPDRIHFGGLGWHFGWGMVYSPANALNDTGRWMFVSPSGTRHLFYDQLHRGEDDGAPHVLYTRDGSYLRMLRHNAFFVDIEFPDGTSRRYNSWTGGFGGRYWFEKVWSPYASAEDPDAWVTYNPAFTRWTLTERDGLTHVIHSSTSFPWLRVITRVDVGIVGGGSVPYTFEYTPTAVDVSCKDTSAATAPRITVPLLTALVLPDGSRFEMPSHHTTCAGGIADVSGVLRELVLPSGGKLRWTWGEYEFPPGASNSEFNTSAGITTRQTVRRDGSVEGTWRYRSEDFGAGPSGQPADDPKMVTQVQYPTGDCSKHYFNARHWQSPAAGRGWEYGLPFDYSQSVDDLYLSVEVYPTSTAGGVCTGAPLRSTYVKYRHDATPGSGSAPAAEWYHTNRRPSATRTVFHDDGGRWVESRRSDFDGLGHFRRVENRGTLWSGSTNQEYRELFTDYNRAQGTYGTAGYVPPEPSDPWVLDVHSYLRSSEPDSYGQNLKRVDLKFDDATGALLCTRVRKSATSLRVHDIVTTYDLDSRGRATDVKTYGGDLQFLPTTGDPCAGMPAQPEYWVRHGYTGKARTSTRPMRPDGTPGSFLTLDVDVDPTTGLVLRRRDPSGLAVSYEYDAMGRNDRVVPQEGARTQTQFVPATASVGPKVVVERLDPVTGASLTRSEISYDEFGRRWRQRSRMPGGAWSERETLYNERGRVASISQWGDLTKTTQYLDYDPFGRATRIRPPEGADHDALVSYEGVRRVVASAKLALVGGEAYVDKISEFDSRGRLRRVEEASGTGGAVVPTVYDYDVASRLTRLRSGSGPVQQRLYSYDNRGFLLSETHPEKGPAGNGSVTYGNRDSRGLVYRVTDGPSDLSYAYDFMGRPTEVRDLNGNNRLVVSNAYDGAVGRGTAKLWKTTRNQWIDVPWVPGAAEELATVTNTLDYAGLAGGVSQKQTRVVVGGETLNFGQGYEWNELGQLARMNYAGQQVDYTYDQGLLTGVPGWGTIEYHSSGLWKEVLHANQVEDHQDRDPDYTRRTGALSVQGPLLEPIGTGAMRYDGAANVSGIGVWSFAYDTAGRLVESDFLDWGQQFTWDSFGNLTQKTTTAPGGSPQSLTMPIDPATNRFSGIGHTYDAAGNRTAWGSANVYGWNESGLMEHALAGPHNWVYLYDAAGERVATLMPSSQQPVVRWTTRDLDNRMIVDYVQVGAVGDPGTTFSIKRNIWAGGRLLASNGDPGVRHYHLDHLGSVRTATDEGGGIVFGMSYLPFGEPTDPIDPNEILQFTGHERDHPTGLDYMHSRFYTQIHGRFLSVDRLRGVPEAPQSLNRYAYALGSPLSLVDPDGRAATGLIEAGTSPEDQPEGWSRAWAHGGTAFMQGFATGLAAYHTPTIFAAVSAHTGPVAGGLVAAEWVGFIVLPGAIDTLNSASAANYQALVGLHQSSGGYFAHPATSQLSLTESLAALIGGGANTTSTVDGVLDGGFGETINVTGASAQLPLMPLRAPGVTVPDELLGSSGSFEGGGGTFGGGGATSVYAASDTVCDRQGCVGFTIVGTDLGDITREARRIVEEFGAVGSLNELISGACFYSQGFACAGGGYAGGSGVAPWTTIYSF